MDYTAVGDTTNLAARMEQMAEPGKIPLTASTYRLVRDFFEFHELGKKKVKGKKEEQEIFELIRNGDFSSRLDAAAARGPTPFIGREEALEELIRGFEKARTGAGRVLGSLERLGSANPGSFSISEAIFRWGNSVTWKAAASASVTPWPISHPGDPPLLFRDLRGRARRRPEGEDHSRVSSMDEGLRPALLPLQGLLGIKVEDPSWLALEPREKRERIFKAARDLLQSESRSRPLVIAIEDLHWTDKSPRNSSITSSAIWTA